MIDMKNNTFQKNCQAIAFDIMCEMFLAARKKTTPDSEEEKLKGVYLRNHKEIKDHYWYCLKEGYCSDETYNWLEKTRFWLRGE